MRRAGIHNRPPNSKVCDLSFEENSAQFFSKAGESELVTFLTLVKRVVFFCCCFVFFSLKEWNLSHVLNLASQSNSLAKHPRVWAWSEIQDSQGSRRQAFHPFTLLPTWNRYDHLPKTPMTLSLLGTTGISLLNKTDFYFIFIFCISQEHMLL